MDDVSTQADPDTHGPASGDVDPNEALPASGDGNGESGDSTPPDSPVKADDEIDREAPGVDSRGDSVDVPAVFVDAEDGHIDPSDFPPALEIAEDGTFGLVGERVCPTCDGEGKIPYGVLQSPRYTTCDECGGIGQILTGSLVAESAVLGCEKCNGTGFTSTERTFVPPVGVIPDGRGEAEPPWPGAIWDSTTGAWTSQVTARA